MPAAWKHKKILGSPTSEGFKIQWAKKKKKSCTAGVVTLVNFIFESNVSNEEGSVWT